MKLVTIIMFYGDLNFYFLFQHLLLNVSDISLHLTSET